MSARESEIRQLSEQSKILQRTQGESIQHRLDQMTPHEKVKFL